MRIAGWIRGLLAFVFITAAHAQPYPAKPVRLIVPFPPGGSSDLVARQITPTLGEFLGQQVVIEYKGGAAGSIGTAEVARAAPDGYTLLIVWDTHGSNHHLYNVQYDFFKSFDPITQLVQAPGILVAHPAFPASSFKDFVAHLRANPGKVSVGIVGAGSSSSLSVVLLTQLTNTRVTFVNYKGGGPLTNDILGGHVDVVFGTYGLWEPHVRSGKLKALAVLGKSRMAQYPDIPAANEIVPGMESHTWFGLLAPAGLPKAILAKVHREAVRALDDPKVKENLLNRGMEVVGSTPEAFAEFLRRQSETTGRLIQAGGIKVE
jgi:tripartite-type tricarboxylate transporter receptor subunit TctC